jgi:mono/diheme cytochrome c family protein
MKLRHPIPAILFGLLLAGTAQAGDALVERGKYLAQIMDCAGCHMPRGKDGAPILEAGLSGGTIGFEIPGLGIFWPPNLTPDATGLGAWSGKDIERALRTGERPDGRALAPAMPWPSYAALSPEDMQALVAYLQALPKASSPTPEPVTDASKAAAPFYRVTIPN